MANHEINEDQDALTRALRMIETGDPVHADVYNALFSVLINNDVFLEKLANKMIQQAMISHVTDCTNSDMVMGADQGPVFTKLIEKVKEQVDVLNTNQQKRNYIKCFYSTADLIDSAKSLIKAHDGLYPFVYSMGISNAPLSGYSGCGFVLGHNSIYFVIIAFPYADGAAYVSWNGRPWVKI